MSIVTCANGHLYASGFDECPECAKALQSVSRIQKPRKSRKKRANSSARGKRATSTRFDSKTEENRYRVLSLLQQAGVISNLEMQPKFTLIPRLVIPANGVHDGYAQRAEVYTADFRYTSGGMVFVEDVKGVQRTKTGQIKPYIKTSSASNKVKDLMRIWANEGKHATHTFLFTVESGGRWLYFNSNRTMIDFELIAYCEAA